MMAWEHGGGGDQGVLEGNWEEWPGVTQGSSIPGDGSVVESADRAYSGPGSASITTIVICNFLKVRFQEIQWPLPASEGTRHGYRAQIHKQVKHSFT